MIHVYLENYDKFGVGRHDLLDFDSDTILLKESQLTRQIQDHMKTGSYTFTIVPGHPAYASIFLKRSVVYVEDDGKIVFRGDVIKIDTDKYGVKKVTCQNDLKWLVDVPDVFSKMVPAETKYNIGSAAGVVYLWFKDIPLPVQPGQEQQYHEYDGHKVYQHFERNPYISVKNIWSDYGFRKEDIGKIYNVTIQNDAGSTRSYEIPLNVTYHKRKNAPNNPLIVLFLGNLNMAPTPPGRDPATMQLYDFDPSTVDLGGLEATETTAGAAEEQIAFEDMDFCIVHYIDTLKKDKITGGEVNYGGRNVSHVYTIQAPPEVPDPHNDRIAVSCSTTSYTTVKSMVNSVFSEYGEALTGYNACVAQNRRIYRGDIQVDGELEYSSVDTCYSNVSKWLDVTGGYASVRYVGDVAYLDLLPDSGVRDDSFSVALGENVSDYSKSEDVLNLVTGIYPTSTVTVTRDGEEIEEEYTLKGKTIRAQAQNPNFEFDSDLGMVFHKLARRTYGTVIQKAEYDLTRVIQSQWAQHLYDKSCDDIRTMLEAFVSFSIDAHDPRLLGKTGQAPVLGNYYSVDIPLWGEPTYMPLTKITQNHVKASSDKLTFGDERATLSDYTAKEAKR